MNAPIPKHPTKANKAKAILGPTATTLIKNALFERFVMQTADSTIETVGLASQEYQDRQREAFIALEALKGRIAGIL